MTDEIAAVDIARLDDHGPAKCWHYGMRWNLRSFGKLCVPCRQFCTQEVQLLKK